MFKFTRSRIIFLIIIVVLFCLFQFGIKVDNIRLGKQSDLNVSQIYDVENSHFYRQYFNDDSLLVLNYWATWCKPCIAEMPMLNDVKRQYQGENIAFISISVDTDSLKLADFIASEKFEFIDMTFKNRPYRTAIMNMLRGKEHSQWIGSYTVPMIYIIKNKKVLEMVDGTMERNELIEMIEKHK